MDSKNIDKLFQEKLNNLEVTPNERVWNSIESKLQNKKRRVIPFWWYAGGVAAIFLLGLFFLPTTNIDNSFDNNDSKIIITETPKEVKKTILVSKKDTLKQNKKIKETILVADETVPKKSIQKRRNTFKEKGETKKLVSTKKAMEKIFLGDNSTKKTTKIENNIQKKNTVTKVQTSDKKFNHLKKNESKKIDFTKAIKKTDSIFSTSDLKKRWSIAPTFAVLSSNSFSKSSPINQNLSSSTRGQNSVSYGVQVNYKLNSKWTIQSGIHVLETRFRNNNVVIGVITNSVNSNIIFNNQNSKVLENNAIANNTDLVSNSFARLNTLSGDLSQNYGYIEIPVEIKYSFYNTKKFNTEIVGGFSSLFLTQNKIDISSQFISTSGLANNLNALNFSGNLGFDFNYLINNHWSFNLNPMFKAQLNTFSQRSNGFKPFNVGIYTGLKYRF